MRIAFTGGRDFPLTIDSESFIRSFFDGENHINVGCARGLDSHVRNIAEELEYDKYKVFKADWSMFGPFAGPERNRRMLLESDCLVVFPGGRGTRNCEDQAKNMGLKIISYAEELQKYMRLSSKPSLVVKKMYESSTTV